MLGLNQCLRLVRNLSFWIEKKNYLFLVDRIGIGKKGRHEDSTIISLGAKVLGENPTLYHFR